MTRSQYARGLPGAGLAGDLGRTHGPTRGACSRGAIPAPEDDLRVPVSEDQCLGRRKGVVFRPRAFSRASGVSLWGITAPAYDIETSSIDKKAGLLERGSNRSLTKQNAIWVRGRGAIQSGNTGDQERPKLEPKRHWRVVGGVRFPSFK